MRKVLKGSLPLVVLAALLLLLACNGKEKEAKGVASKYTCPMHPQIVQDAPGSCPICKMDLVPMDAHSEHSGVNDSLASLVRPTNELVLADIKTIKPQIGSRFEEGNVKGIINYNTNTINSVSTRVSGRIERLYVKYNYQPVSKGQKLMDIYSPDLANAQQELLFLKNNNEPGLLEAAKRKLRLLGATDQQINQVLTTGRVDYTVSIYSPYSGYVSEVQSVGSSVSAGPVTGSTMITSESSAGGSSMDGMSGSSGSAAGSTSSPSIPAIASNSPLQLREGQYVGTGQKLFSLANSSSVWAEFYVNPNELGRFKRGTMLQIQSVDVSSKRTRVPVTLIQPYYSEGSNYSVVRATVPNGNRLWKIGELITVGSESTRKTGTWLPRTAVLQTGTKYVSFTKRNGAFVPIYVTVNTITGDWVDVGNSINSDQEIAVNAWFLVDSESFIKAENISEQ